MKRIFILVVVTLLAGGLIFADERTLIDFSKLAADIYVNVKGLETDLPQEQRDDPPPNQNQWTLVDFSNEATNNFTSRVRGRMQSSLAIENWDVVFSSSSRSVVTTEKSYTRTATSKNAFGENVPVMGVRIHFPAEPFNSSATVKPPFSIPAFSPQSDIAEGDDGWTITKKEGVSDGVTVPSRFEGEVGDDNKLPKDDDGKYTTPAYGIIKNVGTIKSIAVNVYGLNFPHSLSVILIDDKGVEKTYFMGYLNFEGWGELRWDNPAYIQNVRNRQLRAEPIYPDSTPYVKFGGFLIQRQANVKGGDFISYFRDVKVIYDQAVLEVDRDIDDENLWNIVEQRDTARSKTDLQRLGQGEMQRNLDRQRRADPYQNGNGGFSVTDPQENP